VAEARVSLSRMVADYCTLYETALSQAGIVLPHATASLRAEHVRH
jgi:hypothetical protein